MKQTNLIVTFILLTFLSGDLALAQEDQKPNIVFFLVDDLGWSDVGCYGSTFHETPNVDRLAKEGMHLIMRIRPVMFARRAGPVS